MNAVGPTPSGLAEVGARIEAIRARIHGVVSPTTVVPASPGPADASVGGQVRLAGDPPTPAGQVRAAGGAPAPAGPERPAAAHRLVERLPESGRPWAPAIVDAAEQAGIEPALLAAVVTHESAFDPQARSHAGAIGLAQLMPATAASLGVDPTDPLENLAGGARYLREQLDRFGSVELALAAYNAGPRRVVEAGGVPRIPETRTYVDRVTATWEQLR